MRKSTMWLLAGVALVLTASSGWNSEVSRAEIEKTIELGCARILGAQREDGAFILSVTTFSGQGPYQMWACPVGTSGLGTLALQQALPHLKGKPATDAREAVKRSMDWLLKQPPDQKTYSAGVAISVLCKDDLQRHKWLIGEYAAMLVNSQSTSGQDAGTWGYDLYPPQGRQPLPGHPKQGDRLKTGDHSNTQYAVLGLVQAQSAGFQAPPKTWATLRQHYLNSQQADGGWMYKENYRGCTESMTTACTLGLAICDEMLTCTDHRPCRPVPENPAVTRGLHWLTRKIDYPNLGPYEMYSVSRLGMQLGRGEIGGKPWFDTGARSTVAQAKWETGWVVTGIYEKNHDLGTALAVIFLSRTLEPVVVNKLQRADTDDWNNDGYDVKHLVEEISTRCGTEKHWRIVTLETDLEALKRVPILYMSGHERLSFTDEEKAKLKAYVEGGGTILGMACCGRNPFQKSFPDLVKELWPESELVALPKTHPIYVEPKPAGERPQLLGMEMPDGGRLGVIFSPGDLCCRWHMGGPKAKGAFDVGANLIAYVEKTRPATKP